MNRLGQMSMACPNCGEPMREFGAGWDCACGTWRNKRQAVLCSDCGRPMGLGADCDNCIELRTGGHVG